VSAYPSRTDKALHQVQRNRYHHAHGPTAPKPEPLSLGISLEQAVANLVRLGEQLRLPGWRSP